MAKTLYRSKINKMLGGVCGGIAEYFDIDPTIVRLIWLATVLFGGTGVLLYIIAWIIIPENPYQNVNNGNKIENPGENHQNQLQNNDAEGEKKSQQNNAFLGGLILIFIGVIFLINKFIPWFNWSLIWPIFLILIGIAIILKYKN